MKVKRRVLIEIFIFIIIIFLNPVSYAGYQKWNSLNYDAKLNSDGSMDVVETWDIDVSMTNTLFKNFALDKSKYSGITNVSVVDMQTGVKFKDIDTQMYHVAKNYFYALQVKRDKFEIAWGVGLDNVSLTKKYQLSYTIKDAVTVYNDCNELYWKFLDKSNQIPAKIITGQIHLPSPVTNMDNLRVWAHGPLQGKIQKKDNQTVNFEIEKLNAGDMLEVRVVTEEPIFTESKKIVHTNKLNSIISEEMIWANQANILRIGVRIFLILVVCGYWATAIILAMKIMKYLKELEHKENISYDVQVGKYFRDIPRDFCNIIAVMFERIYFF